MDQLRKEQAASRAFLGFREMDPLFAPTFKVMHCFTLKRETWKGRCGAWQPPAIMRGNPSWQF